MFIQEPWRLEPLMSIESLMLLVLSIKTAR